MNWMNALAPWQWIIMALIPPLILMLYFLKLRRVPVEVPSTYLWTKTIEDLNVNSLWQKLRKNLLLFLQLLLTLLLCIACLGPGCESTEIEGDRFIFLVDQSASMSATDTETGQTRLEFAKDEISNIIDAMDRTDSAMIIAFSDRSRPIQSYTTNKSELKAKIRSIEQTERGSDINEALVAASGLANPTRTGDKNSNIADVVVADALPAVMYIFSDGAIKEVPDFFLGNLTPEYKPMGSLDPPHNVGITALSVSDPLESEKELQAFARLFNSDDEDHVVSVTLKVDGVTIDASSGVEVPRNNSTSLAFDLSGFAAGLDEPRKVVLSIDDEDVYMQDNVAYTVLNPPRQSNVLLVSQDNDYLKIACTTGAVAEIANVILESPEFLKTQEYKEQSTLGFYDLIIYDRCAPETMPICNTVFWDSLPVTKGWSFGESKEPTPVVDSDKSHPLMFAIQMDSVDILKSRIVEGPRGSPSLVDSTVGSIMRVGTRAGFQDLVIGFPITEIDESLDINVNTSWVMKLSFPLFIQNMMVHLGGASRIRNARGSKPGDLLQIKAMMPYPSIAIKGPSGSEDKVSARPDNSFIYSGAKKSGIYEVRGQSNSEIDQMLSVNLMDRVESNLTVRENLELGYEKVEGERTRQPTRKEYWTWLLLGALGVLLLEWYIFNRRVFI
jgi:preprotein translocase subunit Sss1